MVDIKCEKHIFKIPYLPFNLQMQGNIRRNGIYTHWHENVEVIYCFEGFARVYIDSEPIDFQAGDIIIVNSKCLHSFEFYGNIGYSCLIIDDNFFNSNGINIGSLIFEKKINDVRANELSENILKAYEMEDDLYGKTRIRLRVLEYLLYLCENFSTRRNKKAEHKTKSYSAVLNALEYINTNFSECIKIEELAEKFNYSKYHFARLFKENTGFTIVEHINKRRCEHARYLLRDSNKSVSQICYECGFDTPSYFSKSFKQQYDMLPSDYRRECRKS